MTGRARALVLLAGMLASCAPDAQAQVAPPPPPPQAEAGPAPPTPPQRPAPRRPAPAAAPRSAQATPAGTRTLPGRMPQLAPVIAIPPGYEPAPTPNPDISAPATRGPTEPQLGATLTRRAQGFGTRGDGFSPGSSYSGYFDKRGRAVDGIGSTLAPSFQLRVPLE